MYERTYFRGLSTTCIDTGRRQNAAKMLSHGRGHRSESCTAHQSGAAGCPRRVPSSEARVAHRAHERSIHHPIDEADTDSQGARPKDLLQVAGDRDCRLPHGAQRAVRAPVSEPPENVSVPRRVRPCSVAWRAPCACLRAVFADRQSLAPVPSGVEFLPLASVAR